MSVRLAESFKLHRNYLFLNTNGPLYFYFLVVFCTYLFYALTLKSLFLHATPHIFSMFTHNLELGLKSQWHVNRLCLIARGSLSSCLCSANSWQGLQAINSAKSSITTLTFFNLLSIHGTTSDHLTLNFRD